MGGLLALLPLSGGVYLGWALGANDASNVFGTAVGARIIPFRTAAIICAVSIIIGAALQGENGIHTLSGLSTQTASSLLVVSLSAAVTVTLMTILKLPISTSQAMVGAILGVGLVTRDISTGGLIKVVVSWMATPVGAMAFSFVIYLVLRLIFRLIPMSILTRDKLLWGGLVAVGAYGSYALGANNVANATGIYSGLIPGVSDGVLALIGGAAIALGVLTFSRRVMVSVGTGLMKLDAFTALVAVSSMSATVHIFAMIGVPVSTSQAIIGAIMGIGIVQGFHSFQFKVLRNFGVGWLLTPAIALLLSAASYGIVFGIG